MSESLFYTQLVVYLRFLPHLKPIRYFLYPIDQKPTEMFQVGLAKIRLDIFRPIFFKRVKSAIA